MYREAVDASVLVVAFSGRVIGMNPATGERLWAYELGSGMRSGEVELLITESRIYACDGRSLICLEYPSGRWLGASPVPGTYRGRPSMVLQGERLFVATSGELSCFDSQGRVLWHDPFQG